VVAVVVAVVVIVREVAVARTLGDVVARSVVRGTSVLTGRDDTSRGTTTEVVAVIRVVAVIGVVDGELDIRLYCAVTHTGYAPAVAKAAVNTSHVDRSRQFARRPSSSVWAMNQHVGAATHAAAHSSQLRPRSWEPSASASCHWRLSMRWLEHVPRLGSDHAPRASFCCPNVTVSFVAGAARFIELRIPR